MLGFVGSSYALFALVWAAMCGLSSMVVTDALLRSVPDAPAIEQPLGDA